MDVHTAKTLAADLLLDFGAAMAGGGLVISGVCDLIAANRKWQAEEYFLKEALQAWLNVLLVFHIYTGGSMALIHLDFS